MLIELLLKIRRGLQRLRPVARASRVPARPAVAAAPAMDRGRIAAPDEPTVQLLRSDELQLLWSEEPTLALPARRNEGEGHVLEALLVDKSVPGGPPAPAPVPPRHRHEMLIEAVRARSRRRHVGRSLLPSGARS